MIDGVGRICALKPREVQSVFFVAEEAIVTVNNFFFQLGSLKPSLSIEAMNTGGNRGMAIDL